MDWLYWDPEDKCTGYAGAKAKFTGRMETEGITGLGLLGERG